MCGGIRGETPPTPSPLGAQTASTTPAGRSGRRLGTIKGQNPQSPLAGVKPDLPAYPCFGAAGGAGVDHRGPRDGSSENPGDVHPSTGPQEHPAGVRETPRTRRDFLPRQGEWYGVRKSEPPGLIEGGGGERFKSEAKSSTGESK